MCSCRQRGSDDCIANTVRVSLHGQEKTGLLIMLPRAAFDSVTIANAVDH